MIRDGGRPPPSIAGFCVALATIMLYPTLALAQSAPTGFNFCAAPTPPPCIDDARTKEKKNCDESVRAYIASVFDYRACLEKETARAVFESNDALDRWRCRQPGGQCRLGVKPKEGQ
jgi:hypothetical protein